MALSRAEKIAVLDALLQELRGEQRVEDWLNSHTSAVVWTMQSLDDGAHYVCHVVMGGKVIAQAKGDDEAEARKQAFTVVFTNEAAAKVG
jgi:hypothetical protein